MGASKDWSLIMEAVLIEVRAAEGGDDAKLLVLEQCSVYAQYAERMRL